MELTGLQIFKYLPGAKKLPESNCKKCGFPTCMAFALKLAKKETDIEKCPYVPQELSEKFFESSKIQQHEIKLSESVVTGGETVMFRHDKTFVNKTVLAVELDCDDKNFDKILAELASYQVERIGEIFKVDAIYLTGNEKTENYQAAVEKVKKAGLALICHETENYKIVKGSDIEDLIQKAESALKQCGKKLILELELQDTAIQQTVEQLTYIRRAAVLKRFEPLTFPVLVKIPEKLSVLEACAAGAFYI